jgi:hypothetical protein
MAFMALIALATVWAVERQSSGLRQIEQRDTEIKAKDAEIEKLKHDLGAADQSELNVDDATAKVELTATTGNVRSALEYKNPVFTGEVYLHLKRFKEQSEDWGRGDFTTDAANYERVLQLFYKNAKKSVFATCNEEYLKFWNTRQSISILRAHDSANQINGATVTRVFMFSTFSNIKPDAIALIKKHAKPKYILAKIFIFDETPAKALGSSLVKDFVIVDQGEPSQATGVTNSFELDAMTAKWMVASDVETEQAVEFIRNHWIGLDEVDRRMKAGA